MSSQEFIAIFASEKNGERIALDAGNVHFSTDLIDHDQCRYIFGVSTSTFPFVSSIQFFLLMRAF